MLLSMRVRVAGMHPLGLAALLCMSAPSCPPPGGTHLQKTAFVWKRGSTPPHRRTRASSSRFLKTSLPTCRSTSCAATRFGGRCAGLRCLGIGLWDPSTAAGTGGACRSASPPARDDVFPPSPWPPSLMLLPRRIDFRSRCHHPPPELGLKFSFSEPGCG